MEQNEYIPPEIGTGEFYTPGLRFREPWPGGNLEGFTWLNEPGMNANLDFEDPRALDARYRTVWAEWDEEKNAYVVYKRESSDKASDIGTESDSPTDSKSSATVVGDTEADPAADTGDMERTEKSMPPYHERVRPNDSALSSITGLQSTITQGIEPTPSELELEKQIVNRKLIELFPIRMEDRPDLGDHLPALPVQELDLPITADSSIPVEDDTRKRLRASLKIMYLTRAYVFENQKEFPLMHKRNMESYGDGYGWGPCMDMYRYTVKKHADNIPGFVPGLYP